MSGRQATKEKARMGDDFETFALFYFQGVTVMVHGEFSKIKSFSQMTIFGWDGIVEI